MRYLRRQSTLILLGLFLLVGAFAAGSVDAQDSRGNNPLGEAAPIQTEIIIPGSNPIFDGNFLRGKVGDVASYLGLIYNFLISIVGAVAGVFILVGGFQYMTAGGDAERVSGAKRRIGNALIGFVLALSSYVILNTINPELVNLDLPKLVKVKTELSYLPFCDDLASQFGIKMEDIVSAPFSGDLSGGTSCGRPGYYTPQGQEEAGEIAGVKGQTGRVWCIFRGRLDPNASPGSRPASDPYSDYGCRDGETESDGLRDGSFKSLSICFPVQGVTNTDLEKDFEDGIMNTYSSLGHCEQCVGLHGSTLERTYKTTGPAGCLAWQNVANNGRPLDGNFSYQYRITQGIIQDTRRETKGKYNRSTRMYYCGYSQAYDTCIYVPLQCEKVDSCGDYSDAEDNEFSIHYCIPNQSATEECHGSETLGSNWGLQTGNARHLAPICSGNPCDAVGVGHRCSMPGLAGFEAFPGVSTLRVTTRVMTAGIAGDIKCE